MLYCHILLAVINHRFIIFLRHLLDKILILVFKHLKPSIPPEIRRHIPRCHCLFLCSRIPYHHITIFLNLHLLLFRTRLLQQWIILRIEVLGFPTLPYISSSLHKFRTFIFMLYASLNFFLYSGTCITPIFHLSLDFFLSTFFLKSSVLELEPVFLYFLFLSICCGIVMLVVRSSIKSILSFE